MILFGSGTVKEDNRGAKVDVDCIAFHVHPDEAESISGYMITAITMQCLAMYGESPKEI